MFTQMDEGRTEHMADRMRQRGIADEVIDVIWELGEWNERTDRLVLSARACAREEDALRKEIKALERHTRKAHQ